MNTKFYTCTLLPEVTRDYPPKLGVRCNETGVIAAFWRKEDQALFLAAPDLLEALEALRDDLQSLGLWDFYDTDKCQGLGGAQTLLVAAIAKATEKVA